MQLAKFDEYTGLRMADLESCDMLALSYFAGRGLPGLKNSDLEQWYCKRDDWAYRVRFETARHMYRFNPKADPPTESSYGNSLPRFLCYFLLQVLQEDCGVRYNSERKFHPATSKPADVFAHGIMDDDGEGGTCASMPLIYVSVGRRLEYPLYLVETRGHLFCRWDDAKGTSIRWQSPDLRVRLPPERFNVEGSGLGIGYFGDAYYREFPEKWTADEIQHGWYLRSLTAKQAMASFLVERGECFWDFGMRQHALQSYHYAQQLVSDDPRYNQLAQRRGQQFALDLFGRADHQKMQRMRLAQAYPHGRGCACVECFNSLNKKMSGMDHGASCQCMNCQQGKASITPQGLQGHPSQCGCAGCRRKTNAGSPFPGHSGFGIH